MILHDVNTSSAFNFYTLFPVCLIEVYFTFSLMSTPPPERVAVKTYVSAFSKERALSAIKFELQRGGQVFYVVPRIKGHNSVSFI
jgi:RecG-like helicase